MLQNHCTQVGCSDPRGEDHGIFHKAELKSEGWGTSPEYVPLLPLRCHPDICKPIYKKALDFAFVP